MALLTPLGIILPKKFNAGSAWGEWGTGKLETLLGYVPEGLKQLSEIWTAPVPNYTFGGEKASITIHMLSYIGSAILGLLAVSLLVLLIRRFTRKHEK